MCAYQDYCENRESKNVWHGLYTNHALLYDGNAYTDCFAKNGHKNDANECDQ